jgi:hypothetical protein
MGCQLRIARFQLGVDLDSPAVIVTWRSYSALVRHVDIGINISCNSDQYTMPVTGAPTTLVSVANVAGASSRCLRSALVHLHEMRIMLSGTDLTQSASRLYFFVEEQHQLDNTLRLPAHATRDQVLCERAGVEAKIPFPSCGRVTAR